MPAVSIMGISKRERERERERESERASERARERERERERERRDGGVFLCVLVMHTGCECRLVLQLHCNCTPRGATITHKLARRAFR
jgi:hypothetical protein